MESQTIEEEAQLYVDKALMSPKLIWDEQTPNVVISPDTSEHLSIKFSPILESSGPKVRKMAVKVHKGENLLIGVATKSSNFTSKDSWEKHNTLLWGPYEESIWVDGNMEGGLPEVHPEGKTFVIEVDMTTSVITFSVDGTKHHTKTYEKVKNGEFYFTMLLCYESRIELLPSTE
jgi:hypothetical protein